MSGAFGTALVTTGWDQATTSPRVNLVGLVHQPQAVLKTLEAQGLSAAQALQQLNNMVQSHAVMLATNRMYFILALIIAMVAAGVWLSPKPKGAVALPSAVH